MCIFKNRNVDVTHKSANRLLHPLSPVRSFKVTCYDTAQSFLKICIIYCLRHSIVIMNDSEDGHISSDNTLSVEICRYEVLFYICALEPAFSSTFNCYCVSKHLSSIIVINDTTSIGTLE